MSLEEGRALLEYENCSSMIVLNVLMMLCCREQAPHSLSQSIRVRLSQMPFHGSHKIFRGRTLRLVLDLAFVEAQQHTCCMAEVMAI